MLLFVGVCLLFLVVVVVVRVGGVVIGLDPAGPPSAGPPSAGPPKISRMLDFGQLAEVEIGRSRNWPKSVEQMVFALFLPFLFFLVFFSFFFSFFSFSSSSHSSFSFCSVSVFVTGRFCDSKSWSWVFLVIRPNPILHFAPFLSTPFEFFALNPSYFLPHFCPNFNFSAVFSIFRQGVRIEPHVTFRVVFVRPNPKLNPTTSP